MQISKDKFKSAFPHIIAIAVFIIISAIYFSPQLKGYNLHQGDIVIHLGMSKEIRDFREINKSEPLWTNSAFCGMPAYQISTKNPNIINSTKNLILRLIPRPIGYMFFLMIGFYILLLCFDVKPWLAIIGSIAFGLSTINILYLGAGHNSRIHAISFIPPLIGSIVYAYRKNFLIGAILLSVFVCLQITANHVQMTYYSLFLILAIIIVEFYNNFKNGLLPKFLKVSSVLLFAGIIGLLPGISNLMVTYEYGKYTIRGESELTISNDNNSKSESKEKALDIDYIKQYSMGFGEVWSLVIPNIKGGKMDYIGNNKEIMKEVSPNYKENVAKQLSYWGEQNSTGGAFYFGASIFLLFVLGMFFINDRIKWALFAASLLAVVLSWKYGRILDWFIEYMPLFNKFRDTKLMLIIAQVSFPLLAVLFLNWLLKNKIDKKKFLYVSLSVTGLLFLFYLLPSVWFDFFSKNDTKQFDDLMENYKGNSNALFQIGELKDEIINARINIFKKDCLRSILFIVSTAVTLYLFIIKKIEEKYLFIVLGLLVLVDIWAVDKRYLNNDKKGKQYLHWVKSSDYYNPNKASVADLEILKREVLSDSLLNYRINDKLAELNKDKKLKSRELNIAKEDIQFRELNFATNYRVFSLLNPFSNGRTSYYHKSLGGYHGAKLRIYQELVDFYISNEYSEIINVLNNKPDNEMIQDLLKSHIPVLNMLNTKYLIYNLELPPISNPYHYGNAWFIDTIKIVDNADQEILEMKSIDKRTAIVQQKYLDNSISSYKKDTLANIKLTSYNPNHLIYESNTSSDQFAVFSEIYYDKGWNAYIDGKKVEYVKANYVLRAMHVPKGKHIIEFKFEPKTYYIGKKISYTGSELIILLILGVVFFEVWKSRQKS